MAKRRRGQHNVMETMGMPAITDADRRRWARESYAQTLTETDARVKRIRTDFEGALEKVERGTTSSRVSVPGIPGDGRVGGRGAFNPMYGRNKNKGGASRGRAR